MIHLEQEHGSPEVHVRAYDRILYKFSKSCVLCGLRIPISRLPGHLRSKRLSCSELARRIKAIVAADFNTLPPQWKSSFESFVLFDFDDRSIALAEYLFLTIPVLSPNSTTNLHLSYTNSW